ncbi:MAG: hypothetical protein P8168_14950 [Deltaproteobacteria bacterium]
MVVSLYHYFIGKQKKGIRPYGFTVHVRIMQSVHPVLIHINISPEIFAGGGKMYVSANPEKDLGVFLQNFIDSLSGLGKVIIVIGSFVAVGYGQILR